jgi:hypothetical protein
VKEIRRFLSWQPLFGSGPRIGYMETLELPMDEVSELIDWTIDQRRAEWKAAFGKKR